MTNRWRVGCLVAGTFAVGFAPAMFAPAIFAPAMAQAPMQAPRTYECAANAHCSVDCQVDGDKQMQTGAPKTFTITPIAPNNYVAELVEQNGHVQTLYLAGGKIVCDLDGMTRKGAE